MSSSKCGWLHKLGGMTGSSWQKRWFILDGITLSWYKGQQDIEARGSLSLKDVRLTRELQKDLSFSLLASKKNYHLCADNANEFAEWRLALLASIDAANVRKTTKSESRQALDGNFAAPAEGENDDFDEGDDVDAENSDSRFLAVLQQTRDGGRAAPVRSGYLWKRGRVRTGWKHRWCVLTSKSLSYFKSPTAAAAAGILMLRDVKVATIEDGTESRDCCFELISGSRTYTLSATDSDDLTLWLNDLRTVITQAGGKPGMDMGAASWSGWLEKKGTVNTNLAKRFFRLFPRVMAYYKDEGAQEPLGVIQLSDVSTVGPLGTSPVGIEIVTPRRTFELFCPDSSVAEMLTSTLLTVVMESHSQMETHQIHKFDVQKIVRGGVQKPRSLIINLHSKTIGQALPGGHTKYTNSIVNELLQVSLSLEDPRLAKLSFVSGQYLYQFTSSYARFQCTRILRSLCPPPPSQPKEIPLSELQIPNGLPCESVRVMCATWNLGGNSPPEDMTGWLPPNLEADVIAIGLQESNYNGQDSEKALYTHLENTIGSTYIRVASEALWEIRIIVFVSRHLATQIGNVESCTIATGIANVLGNKGGSVVSFTLRDTHLVFVNCHLAARVENIAARNANAADIVGGAKLGRKSMDITAEADYCFWMGDLNYRVEMPWEPAVACVKSNDLAELRKHDQFPRARENGQMLHNFWEPQCNFSPTYRWLCGEDEFSRKKEQAPSWTDRVLVRTSEGLPIKVLEYEKTQDIRTSDHRPVRAVFDIATSYFSPPMQSTAIYSIKLLGIQVVLDGNTDGIPPLTPFTQPRLKLYGNFLEGNAESQPSTKVAENKIEWLRSELPQIVPFVTQKTILEGSHLHISIVDFKSTSLGQATILLGNVMKAQENQPGQDVDSSNQMQTEGYTVDLTLRGQRVGSMTLHAEGIQGTQS